MWSQVECGYDSANETIVFGSRQIAEGDALYESSTVAVVSTEGQVYSNPIVQGAVRNGRLLLAIDNTFRILSNSCTSLDLYVCFESSISSFSISFDYKILLFCLNDGSIHCLHIPSSGKVIFSTFFSENMKNSSYTIFSTNDNDSISFIICSKQRVYRLKINNINEVYNQIDRNCEHIEDNFSFIDLNIKVNSSVIPLKYEDDLFYISNKKCFANCDNLYIALDDDETIIGINKLTEMIYKLFHTELVKELLVLKSFNSEDHRLLIISACDNEYYIKLLSYPNFDTIYRLKVCENTYFISLDSDQDDIMFIEGVCSKGSKFINELRLKVITESNPDTKLKRLLQRNCFEDAKKLARTFNLNMQLIYIAETEEYITKNNFHIIDVEKFCNLLDNVNDIICIIEHCLLNTTVDSLTNVEKLLKYSYNRLQHVLLNNPDDISLSKYKSTILNLFFKLDTFKILHCSQNFANSDMLMNSWLNFSQTDLFDEMKYYLINGKIKECTILFTKLQHENILDCEKIYQILQQLNHMSLTDYLPLLRQIIFFSVHSDPQCLPVTMNWIYNSVLHPKNPQSNWLDYTINFCETINKYLDLTYVQSVYIQKQFAENGCLTQFKNLLRSLNDLQTLSRNYGINLSISEFSKNPNDLTLRLLDEISLKQLNDFMNNFIIKYCKEYMIDVDNVLSEYIKFISGSEKLLWDQTVIQLIPFISSNTLKMETIVMVLENASVPWSNIIEKLARQGSEDCHSLAEKITNLKRNIPWKMLLNTYQISEQATYDNNHITTIIKRMLLFSKQSMLDDIEIVVSRFPHLKERSQVLCFTHFVLKGQMEDALQFLTLMKNNSILDCFTAIEMFAQSCLWSNFPVHHFLEILSNSILMRLQIFLPEYEFDVYKNRVKKIQNIFILKQKYGCNQITNFNYNVTILLPEIISNVLESVNDDKIDWFDVVNRCEELSHLLELPKEKCFFELEKQTNSLQSLNICAENIVNSDSNAQNMAKMALILMKHVNKNDNISEDKNTITALQLINKLSVKSCVKADYQQMSSTSEILNWSNCCFWTKNDFSNHLLQRQNNVPLFQPENYCTLSTSSSLIIKEFFDLLKDFAGNRIIWSEYLKENKDDIDFEEQILNNLDSLPQKMRQLHIEGYDMIVYNYLNIIKTTLLSISSNEEFSAKVMRKINFILNSQCITQLLDKILVSKKIDLHFALSLFLSPDFQPLKWVPVAIKKYKLNVKKLHAISSLACSYIELRGYQEQPYKAYLNLKYRCEWWQKFLHNCVSYNDTFQLKPKDIAIAILKSDKLNLKILMQFCHDFELNVQKFLMMHLENSLLQWKPIFENKTVSNDYKLFKQCKEIISKIDDKVAAVKQLDKAWSEISYYQHEVYLCILDLFNYLEKNCTNPDKGVLLMFLKDYKRINKPQQKEIDNWQIKYPLAREIDPLSQYRLPYFIEMYTKDFWEIIRPEINLMTYEKWFANASFLGLDRNLVCVFAIKGTINSGILNTNDSNWSATPRHESLLETMEMCIKQIDDPKLATAVLYTGVRKVSNGADQVSIAKMCWKKAEQWMKSARETDNDIHLNYSDVKRTEKYLNLIENTEQLIRELYQDESIAERSKGTASIYPDINRAVDELATQLCFDTTQIKISLIMEFLHASCKIVNFDETINVQNTSTNENDSRICDNLKCVIYICESKDRHDWYNLLSNISFAKIDETISTFHSSPDLSMRIKALQCLLVITKDIEKLEEVIGESPNVYLEKLEILSSLESIGYSLTVSELDCYKKIDLISKILRNKLLNSMVVSSLAKLCAIYEIWNSTLWNKIIQNFIDLKMLADLQKWLPKLYKFCYSPDLNSPYVNGWSCLIKNLFLKALNESDYYYQGFISIQSCPVASMLDSCFLEISDLYIYKNIFEVSAILIPYIQDQQSRKKILEHLKLIRNEQLYEKIESFSSDLLINTDYVIQIVKNYE